MWQCILVCRPFCYKTCTRILRVQPRLQMGQVSIIDNFFPQESSQKLEPHYIAPGLCYAEKKMNVFSKSTLYVFSFTTLDQLDLQLQGFQYNLVESYLIWAFLKTTSRICPMKLGKKIFCIALCLGEVTILNGGSERSFLLTNFVV